ncbi:MAG: OB-fold nucleic acid binding domain-containing protein [Nanoarchaeota archaeon]|nr:OB-fold nucleic acid binding domain-containing protein [Nanoarchaeota archaeon]
MKKIALIISLVGILILLFIINTTSPKIVKISSIEKEDCKEIKIKGTISEIKNYKNKFTTFTITDSTGKIQGVCNCPNVQQNQTAEITGKIQEYQNNLQINVEKIKIIS